MTQSVDFTREFAHLVWLLLHRTAMIDEQKLALRLALSAVREGECLLSLGELNRGIALAAGMSPVPTEVVWIEGLALRIAEHSVSLIAFTTDARASDVLGVARVLASPAVLGDEGAHFDARVLALGPRGVTVRLGRDGFVRRPTPAGGMRLAVTPHASTPPLGTNVMEAVEAARPTPATPLWATKVEEFDRPAALTPEALTKLTDQGSRMVEAAFTHPGRSRALDELFFRLEGDLTSETVARVLDELSRSAEEFARDGLWIGTADVLTRIIARESLETDAGIKRAFLIHLRRLLKPGILRGVAGLLSNRRELRESVEDIFRRAGEVGAEVLIEVMVTSPLASERRSVRSAIARCPAAARPLLNLLDDRRWYVVRNAADLLGEMNLEESDSKLISTLKHSDSRVRRSATSALARLATARALHALEHVVEDVAPAVRIQAVHGLTVARSVRAVPALLKALDHEQEVDVQHAILAALGHLPTDAAVERLLQAAQPGSLLSRKPAAFRIAAVHALGEAGTHASAAGLRALQEDRDRDVRGAVERALAARVHGTLANR